MVRALAIFAQRPTRKRDADEIYLFFLFYQDTAGPEVIKFGIESKKSCQETSTEALIDATALALQEMRDVCASANLRIC